MVKKLMANTCGCTNQKVDNDRPQYGARLQKSHYTTEIVACESDTLLEAFDGTAGHVNNVSLVLTIIGLRIGVSHDPELSGVGASSHAGQYLVES